MTLTRRQVLSLGATAAGSLRSVGAEPSHAARPRIRLAVSTYSYWHFKTEKYPIEKRDRARGGAGLRRRRDPAPADGRARSRLT